MSAFKIETGTLTFSSADTGVITFSLNYKRNPVVVATCEDDVNVFVESVSKTSATIRTSNRYSGNIQYQIISND